MKGHLIFSLFATFLFSLNGFAEGTGPCPETPQETPSTPSAPSTPSGPSDSHVSTPPADTGASTRDHLGTTLDPSQQQGGGSSVGTFGGSGSGGDNKKPFGPSEFMVIMRAYLDNARIEIKAKEKELKEKAALRRMERSVGLKSKLREAEEAFDGLVKAHERLGKIEGKVEKLEKNLKQEKMRLEIDREVHGVSYRQKDVDKIQNQLNEFLPEYNAAKAELNKATENYLETHDVLNQAHEDMAEMEREFRDNQNASLPKPRD